MYLSELLERAKKQLAGVTGLKPVAVTRAAKEDGHWRVGLDMLELSRIPAATDVLGDYELLLSEDGDMLQFERKRTRLRGQVEEEATA